MILRDCIAKVTFICIVFQCMWKEASSNPSCPKLKDGMINVHLVCHTHDDVGWLKTVDEYYYGAKKTITWVGVQYILDSVIPSLLRDPTRKFIYVESAFFFRWWDEQDKQMKETVKGLVENRQLEFIGGGWSMNDEAAAHYNAIIDQMTLGLRKLNSTFGSSAAPRIAWQIDPFGHSKEQASLFAQMGMDGLFFGRLDHDDKTTRWLSKQMEMVWKGSNSLGNESWLFTGVLPNCYSPPRGFCFDLLCADDPIMDDPNLEEYNKDKMVDDFLKAVKMQSTGYATSNLIMTMGEDFNYVYAESWYKNLDKLIKYVNERQAEGSKVNLIYSTPSCYLDALHDAEIKWPTKSDDFFPYSSDPHAYWTGYFTSRPTFKYLIRKSNNVLQAAKQISALIGKDGSESFEKLANAMAVAQHHDAVTGTAKQNVTNDYYKRLSEGISSTYDALAKGMNQITQSRNAMPTMEKVIFCPQLNISACPELEYSKSFVASVYNPIARPISHYVRIPVAIAMTYDVKDEEDKLLKSQIVPLPKQVQNIPGRLSQAKYELVFYAENLPPLAVKQFLVTSTGQKGKLFELRNRKNIFAGDLKITKGNLTITLDAVTKRLNSIATMNFEGKVRKVNVSQNWCWYHGMKGNNSEASFRASGAYIFRPDGGCQEISKKVEITGLYDGPLVGEFHQEWSPWVTQILRIYKNMNFVEIEWLVGPIPIEDGIGKEIVSRTHWKDMKTENTFFTDANGREMQKRVKDKRETWNFSSSEPVSQNYYPVTSRLILNSINGQGKAAIMNDRAQGGTSLSDGEMELMVHRRLLYDDAFGVGEALNETAFGEGLVARGRHLLIHSDVATPDCDFGCQHRTLGEELLLQPIIAFVEAYSFNRNPGKLNGLISISALPRNMRLLTLEPLEKEEWLVRLENFYEKGESSLSGTSSVDLKELFSNLEIRSIVELTLGANQLKKENIRLKWKTKTENDASEESSEIEDSENVKKILDKNNYEKSSDSSVFTFAPMQIRTFKINITCM